MKTIGASPFSKYVYRQQGGRGSFSSALERVVPRPRLYFFSCDDAQVGTLQDIADSLVKQAVTTDPVVLLIELLVR